MYLVLLVFWFDYPFVFIYILSYKGGDAYCFGNVLSMGFSLDVLSYLFSLLIL